MRKGLKWSLALVIVMLFISYKEYSVKNFHAYQKPSYIYKEFNTTLFKTFLKQPETNSSVVYLWGLHVRSKKINKNLLDANQTDKQVKSKVVEITQTKSALCIEKSCYRLLGFYKKNKNYVSFFSKDSEPHIKTITKGDSLNNLIELESIKKNKIILSEINATRKWSFKLFDVNTTKYKPKKETK